MVGEFILSTWIPTCNFTVLINLLLIYALNMLSMPNIYLV